MGARHKGSPAESGQGVISLLFLAVGPATYFQEASKQALMTEAFVPQYLKGTLSGNMKVLFS